MVKFFLITLIKLYWKVIPENRRRVCLYKESCSRHVFNISKKDGVVAGIKTFVHRMRNCNNHYLIMKDNNLLYIITSQKEVITSKAANPFVLKGF